MENRKKNSAISSPSWKKFQFNQHQLLASFLCHHHPYSLIPALSRAPSTSSMCTFIWCSCMLSLMCPSETLKVPASRSALKLG